MAAYTPNTWVTDEIISKTKLDRLEDGVATRADPDHTHASGFTLVTSRNRTHMPLWTQGARGTATVLAGVMTGAPIFLQAGTVNRLAIPSMGGTAAAGSLRLGIYTLDRSDPTLSPLLLDAGVVDLSNPNAHMSVTFTLAVTAGWYILASAPTVDHGLSCIQNGGGQAGMAPAVSMNPIPVYGWAGATGVTGALPATFGGTGNTTTMIPVVTVGMDF